MGKNNGNLSYFKDFITIQRNYQFIGYLPW